MAICHIYIIDFNLFIVNAPFAICDVCLNKREVEKVLYDKIKEIAEEKEVSIYRIEKDTGISNGTISKWNTAIPSSNYLKKVADYLEVSIETLLIECK